MGNKGAAKILPHRLPGAHSPAGLKHAPVIVGWRSRGHLPHIVTSGPTGRSTGQLIIIDLSTLNAVPCLGLVFMLTHISLVGECSIITSP